MLLPATRTHLDLFAGLLCDLLWSDPDKEITGWSENDRGVSFTFGPDVVSRFLQKHDMDLICRAHQVVEDGYEFFAKRQLVTLFSAPYVATLPSCTSLAAILAAALELLYSFPHSLQKVADSSNSQQQLLWRIRQRRCDDVGRPNATLLFPSASLVILTPFVA